jgi:hypothetical protein
VTSLPQGSGQGPGVRLQPAGEGFPDGVAGGADEGTGRCE